MLLSDQFIDQYKDKSIPWGGNGLGFFVYLRTYSRWIEQSMRREQWHETVRRVVEYSMSLYEGPAREDELRKEAEEMFDNMYNLRVFTAGRTLWIGGTEAAKLFGSANFNCAFVVIDSIRAFIDSFHLLMVGSGVGFRVLSSDVEKLPALNTGIKLIHTTYNARPKELRLEDTIKHDYNSIRHIQVGDSKNGWTKALEYYLETMQSPYFDSIIINYDSVRPSGEILKTFGGRASGHTALQNMFDSIHKVIQSKKDGKLLPIHAMDIMNHIGKNVVVGGVRRTSEIALFDQNDDTILNAKVDLWKEGSVNYGQDQRSMSNNSIFFENKPTKEYLLDIFKRIQSNGEPGIINADAARKRRPNFKGLNPCAEILLDDKGVCNLTEVNMTAFLTRNVDNTITYDMQELKKAVEMAVRIGMRQTNIALDLPEWDKMQKRDRLIGVSLSGVMDFEEALGWRHDNNARSLSISDELSLLLQQLRYIADNEVMRYAYEMRIPIPLLSTTIKPSGTISKLPYVSSGVHRSPFPYGIRRVRISAHDPLAKVMLHNGYPVYPENSSNGSSVNQFDSMNESERLAVLNESNTWVIEFPVKTPAKIKASEESALAQFYRYLDFQEYWTEHNTSITITFAPDEIESLVDALLEHWDDYIAVSFLPKFDTDTPYPLMPEQAITEEEYNNRAQLLVHVCMEDIVEELKEIERENIMSELIDADCATGACPIR